MKKLSIILIALCSLLHAPCVTAANRPLTKTWDINNGANRPMELSLFQADGVDLTLTSLAGSNAFALTTNDIPVWEIAGWTDYTNVYASCTGSVSVAASGITTYTFDPAALNLPRGTYRGFVKAVTASGTNITTRAVLAYQRIKMEFSPAAGNFAIVTPSPYYYTKTEADLLHVALLSEVSGQTLAFSNQVVALEARSNVWNSAASAVSGSSNVWNSVTGAMMVADYDNGSGETSPNAVDFARYAEEAGTAVASGDADKLGGYPAVYYATTNDTATLTSDLGSLTTVVGTATGQVATLTSDLNSLITVVGPATGQIGILTSDLGSLTTVVGTATGQVATLTTDVQTLETNVYTISETDDLIADATPVNYSVVSNAALSAVAQNAPIVITNSATWTGWTTTGDLVGDAIFLDTDEYLLSPVQTNGIADWDIDETGSGLINWTHEIVTNSVNFAFFPPCKSADAQVRITAGEPLPMMNEGMMVSNVTLVGYTDLADAAVVKYVSSLCRVDAELLDCDLTRKTYVDGGDADSVASAAASLASYAADADKTLRGSQLRLGNMWVVSPADSTGTRFIMSGGEIAGDGQLIGTTNEFVIAKNDYPLMTFQSDSSGLFITNYTMAVAASNITVSLYIATNGVIAAPFAEWTESLVVGEWSRVQTLDTETYPAVSNDTYELTFTLPLTDQMYFRAMQQTGESVATLQVDAFDVGTSVFRFHGSVGGTNRVAELSWDFTNNVFRVEVTDE